MTETDLLDDLDAELPPPDPDRISRCGPASGCALSGHRDRLPGVPLKDHVWLPADRG